VHERDLRFDGREVADLLGWAGGRAVLVSLIEDDADRGALRALDALALARTQPEILAGCLDGVTDRLFRTRVVLVADAFSSLLQERLGPLLGDDLWLVRRRELRSNRGSTTRLELVDRLAGALSPGRHLELEWPDHEATRRFLARIAPDRLALAIETVERIQRIDPELDATEVEGSLYWRLGDAPLCVLSWVNGHLELCLDGSTVPHAIRDEAAIDFVLDWVMASYLEALEAEGSAAREEPLPPVARDEEWEEDEPPAEGLDEGEPEEDDDLAPLELRPAPPGPILTPEEIEAFRE